MGTALRVKRKANMVNWIFWFIDICRSCGSVDALRMGAWARGMGAQICVLCALCYFRWTGTAKDVNIFLRNFYLFIRKSYV